MINVCVWKTAAVLGAMYSSTCARLLSTRSKVVMVEVLVLVVVGGKAVKPRPTQSAAWREQEQWAGQDWLLPGR